MPLLLAILLGPVALSVETLGLLPGVPSFPKNVLDAVLRDADLEQPFVSTLSIKVSSSQIAYHRLIAMVKEL